MQKIHEDDVLVAKVTGIAKYGIFVTVDEVFSGLVHISEISDKYVGDIAKYVEVGDNILVRVLSIDDDRLTLSIKGMNYKVKKSCIDIKPPKLKYDPKEFKILENNLDKWLDEF